jgi:outer membrane receptor for Fe3+-dicitrate
MKVRKEKSVSNPKVTALRKGIALALAVPVALILPVEQSQAQEDDTAIEEIRVTARKTTYGANNTTLVMMEQVIPGGNVMDVVGNIPGVIVAQGAIFGSDDGSTSISMRGFHTGQNEQQIGMTIDGLPNGNSNYGGGSKANRFIDNANLARAEVSQGTADISSPSHEALGGTLEFITSDPNPVLGGTVKASLGSSNAQYYYGRFDTGEILDNTYAYLSYSHTNADSWIGDTGEMTREHFAAKIVSEVGDWTLTGRVSWDDADEFDMQRISIDAFKANPDWDLKVDDWVGVPFIDQAFRQSGRTLRENTFTYFKAEFDNDNFKVSVTPYYHDNSGRGDWTPARINVVENFSTTPGSGLSDNGPNTVFGGVKTGEFWYADADGSGNPAVFDATCTATLFTANDGTSSPQRNPACYPAGSIPVMSYRHTHYAKERVGFTANIEKEVLDGHTLRAGLWVERADRDEARDVHELVDARVSNEFFSDAYWVQYDRSFQTDNVMVYLQDTYERDNWTIQGGIKQFNVDLERTDNFGIQDKFGLTSDSDVLFSLGGVYSFDNGMEVFAGFSQGYAPIKTDTIESLTGDPEDTTLDVSAAEALALLEGETTNNFDIGLRYVEGAITASVVAYFIEFDNRITSVKPVNDSGFVLSDDDDIFINVGGVESKGVEASVAVDFADSWNLYSSLTINESSYSETKGSITKGNDVALTPKFQFVSTLSYDDGDRFHSGLSGKYVGAHFGDFDNLETLPSSIVVDFWAGYRFDIGDRAASVSINATNIFDEDYLAGGSPRRYNIGIGRQFMTNFQFSF